MSQRVLVVDDDSQMLKAITDALTARGYEVLTAGNGEVALRLRLKKTSTRPPRSRTPRHRRS